MALNIEIKARISEPEVTRKRAIEVSGADPEKLYQRDTFYIVPNGRLKLRENNNRSAEMIYYDRPDESGPKISNYVRIPILDVNSAKQLFSKFLEIKAIVCKHRQIFVVGTTRIHLDEVQHLGSFLELEITVAEGQMDSAKETALRLMEQLGVREEDLVEQAYVDLISEGSHGH